MKREAFFIPFGGCARRCVYCDQNAITADAAGGAFPGPEAVAARMKSMLVPVELCYFGGSFAKQSHDMIVGCLDAVRSAPAGSTVTFSSYPGDFYGPSGDELISLLREYPIGTIELGVPSLDEDVLAVCGRPDEPENIKRVLVKLRDAGFHLGAQIMTGLPGQTVESSKADIENIGALIGDSGPWDLRIYPCLVLRGTELEVMYRAGAYKPLGLDCAVRWVGTLLRGARRAGFKVIRVGLQESASLRESVVAGPWHPAFGELAFSEAAALDLAGENPAGPWHIDHKKISHLTGHGMKGILRLSSLTGIRPGDVRKMIILDP
ncbi:MAG: radical SAM protein [Synergistaceae bacterium]|jgi:histone acetyltransferase (RNA polymerase elongator complex component)|nr:radical SAM protein [Synergistaceae bacterium]